MAVKQHCDICDRVIPGTEGYRTIHFGRGYNTDVNTGYEPLVVCHDCWFKMLDSVGAPELYRNIDSKPKAKPVYATPVGNITPVLKEIVKSCATCKYQDNGMSNYPCNACIDKMNWEDKDDPVKL